MKYKICEYERGNGEKYWTVSFSYFGLFWTTLKELDETGFDYFDYVYVTKQYKKKEDAIKQVENMKRTDAANLVKRIKCEIV